MISALLFGLLFFMAGAVVVVPLVYFCEPLRNVLSPFFGNPIFQLLAVIATFFVGLEVIALLFFRNMSKTIYVYRCIFDRTRLRREEKMYREIVEQIQSDRRKEPPTTHS